MLAGDKGVPVHSQPLVNLNKLPCVDWRERRSISGLSHCLWTVHTPTAEQTEQRCVFQGSAYGGRFTLSASSCGSIKALAEWICGHLLWTKIQGAELYSANICNVCLDLTLHALHADNKHCPAPAWARARTKNIWAILKHAFFTTYDHVSCYF